MYCIPTPAGSSLFYFESATLAWSVGTGVPLTFLQATGNCRSVDFTFPRTDSGDNTSTACQTVPYVQVGAVIRICVLLSGSGSGQNPDPNSKNLNPDPFIGTP